MGWAWMAQARQSGTQAGGMDIENSSPSPGPPWDAHLEHRKRNVEKSTKQ